MNKASVKKILIRILRIALKALAIFFAVLLLIVALINIPVIQTFITQKIASQLKTQYNIEVRLGAIKVKLPKTVSIQELYVAGQDIDTLLYIGRLDVNVSLFALLQNEVNVDNLEIENLRGEVFRGPPGTDYNFQFIIDAFAGDSLQAEKPENESAPWEISVDNIFLSAINARYRDETLGMDAKLNLGVLELVPELIDINKFSFFVDDIRLENTSCSFEQWKVSSESKQEALPLLESDTSNANTSLPAIGLNHLLLNNIDFKYLDRSTGLSISGDLGKFLLVPKEIDLTNQKIGIELAELSNTRATIVMSGDTSAFVSDSLASNKEINSTDFDQFSILPGWDIKLGALKIDEFDFSLDDNSSTKVENGIDYSHLLIQDFAVDLQNLYLKDSQAGIEINHLTFKEGDAVVMRNLSFSATMNSELITLSGLDLQTDKSRLKGDARAHFDGLGQLIQNPEHASFKLDIIETSINTCEVFYLAGINPEDSVFSPYNGLDVRLETGVSGSLDSLNIEKFDLSLLGQTHVKAKGQIMNLLQTEALSFDIIVDTLTTGREEIIRLSDTSYFEGIILPDTLFINLMAKGKIDSVNAVLNLYSEMGDLSASAFYFAGDSLMQDSAYLNLDLSHMHLGKILSDTAMGALSMTVEASGSGLTSNSPSAQINGELDSVFFQDYTYRDIDFEASLKNLILKTSINSNDPNILFDFLADVDFKNESKVFHSSIDIKLLNLLGLELSKERLGFRGKLGVQGNYAAINNLNVEILTDEVEILREETHFDFQPVIINAVLTPKSTQLNLSSDILGLDFDSNFPLDEMEGIITLAVKKYLRLSDSLELPPEKNLDFSLNMDVPSEFKSYFFPELEEILLDSITGKYSSSNNELNITLNAPKIKWKEIEVDTLTMHINGAADSMVLAAGFENLFYDTLRVGKLSINEIISEGKITSSIQLAHTPDETDYLFNNIIDVSDTGFVISFVDSGLILNRQPWLIHPDNYLMINDSGIIAHQFVFTENAQKFGFESLENKNTISAANFKLSNLLGILNDWGDYRIFKGILDAEVQLPRGNKYEGIQADLSLRDFYFLGDSLGALQFNLSEKEDKLDLMFSMINSNNSIKAKGFVGKSDYPQPLNVEVDVDLQQPGQYEVFTLGQLSDMNGSIRGKLNVGGTLDSPSVMGSLSFLNAQIRVNQLNLMASLKDESIYFKNESIEFDNFTIVDTQGGTLVLDGRMKTDNYTDYAFDMNLKAKGFQSANSTKNDNKTLYGIFVFDADIDLKGDTDLPRVDANITIMKQTDLTYVMPGSEIELVSSEGIVQFKHPTQGVDTVFSSVTQDYLTDSVISKFQGIDLAAKLEIDPKAKFTVVIDPFSGDYASVSGSAHLNFLMDPSGTQTLTGIYEVSQGIYQLSFYGLVKKTFEFEPGSSIAWSGRLMDANINFTAKNIVRTNSIALVANESSGMTEEEKNMFKQRLPYEVLLNVDGFLSEPKVGFNIELPEKYLVSYPAISSKLTMLNSGQNESELNKQVFALLVSGSFIADSPFASTGGSSESFATTAARNSVNGILADQLNKISNRFIKGVDMNFGLTSYQDYSGSSSEMRTELDVHVSKKLMDDRLTIEASGSFDVEGSRQYTGTNSSHTYGEFSATYDLSSSKEYKIRAFRENAYDIFDGEIAYSGFSFIIEKSFNSLLKRKKNNTQGTDGEKANKPDDKK